ncbi:DUF4255 domain-containing protein [Mongoliitalea daihaiensis]|uniref:DUF4255 domain-containing protein n=1 Tax=Mongoliitalea daihaiensis TaxID=2782006 RepID=UPI001F38CED9|nr:DUF4255 domain-containing protein [Mongoliitalea daihaiensis]UJP63793.1 DUF4255 domain-containing protein [Mongoliitalea daihaiensis]
MIYETLHIIASDLANAFVELTEQTGIVELNHVGKLEEDGQMDKVIISLVHVMQEATLKNLPNQIQQDNQVQRLNKKIPLNLYVIFCSNFSDYDNALKNLSFILEYFQAKKVFTDKNTFFNRESEMLRNLADFRFSVELFSPSFDELNQIWGTLGGKQVLSAIYKVSVIDIELRKPQSQVGQITSVQLKTQG